MLHSLHIQSSIFVPEHSSDTLFKDSLDARLPPATEQKTAVRKPNWWSKMIRNKLNSRRLSADYRKYSFHLALRASTACSAKSALYVFARDIGRSIRFEPFLLWYMHSLQKKREKLLRSLHVFSQGTKHTFTVQYINAIDKTCENKKARVSPSLHWRTANFVCFLSTIICKKCVIISNNNLISWLNTLLNFSWVEISFLFKCY